MKESQLVDIVFEHVGQATFPTSVFVVKPFGKVVICGATSGFQLEAHQLLHENKHLGQDLDPGRRRVRGRRQGRRRTRSDPGRRWGHNHG